MALFACDVCVAKLHVVVQVVMLWFGVFVGCCRLLMMLFGSFAYVVCFAAFGVLC